MTRTRTPQPHARPGRVRAALASLATAAALASLVVAPSAARAQHAPPTARAPRRPRPDFDGRPPPPTRATAVLAWIPRALLFPAVLALEAVRAPAGAVLRSDAVYNALAGSAGMPTGATPVAHDRAPHEPPFVFPVFGLDLGRRPWVGITGGLALPSRGPNRVAATAATGGERFWLGELDDRVRLARSMDVGARLAYAERPDNPVYSAPGVGTATPLERFFWLRRASTMATASLGLGPAASLFVAAGPLWTAYELPLDVPWLAQSAVPSSRSYAAFATDAELVLDTRGPPAARRSGVRLDARLHHRVELDDPLASRWIVAEGYAGAYLEVVRPGRQLGVEAMVADAEALGSAPVPFAELPTLGGESALRGFLEGRFRGPTAAAATLSYRWPIWLEIEASTRLSVGNTFGPRFAGFAPGALFASWDVSLATRPGALGRVELLVGLGSTRFDAARFGIEHVRLLAALTRSF